MFIEYCFSLDLFDNKILFLLLSNKSNDFVIGNGGKETAEEFLEKIKGHEMNYIANDY